MDAGGPDDIEAAISHLTSAMNAFPPDSLERAVAQANLGSALGQRSRGSIPENIELGLKHLHEATNRFREIGIARDGQDSDLDRDLKRLALNGLSTMASLLVRRVVVDRSENLETALDTMNLAVSLAEELNDREQLSVALNNLGLTYGIRLRGDRNSNIEQSIGAYQKALQVLALDTPRRADVLLNLAVATMLRWEGRTGQNLEEAIAGLTTASRIADITPATKYAIELNLGFAYQARGVGSRRSNLEEASRHFLASQTLISDPSLPEFARAEGGMGDVLAAIGELDKDDGLLTQALVHYERATQVFRASGLPREWAIVQNSVGHLHSGFTEVNDERARLSLDAFHRALDYFREFFDPLEVGRSWAGIGFLHLRRGEWHTARTAFGESIDANDELFLDAFTDRGRHQSAGSMSELYTAAAYCAAELGEHGRALELLDKGKARILGESIAKSGALLTRLPDSVAERIASSALEVSALSHSPAAPTSRDLPTAWRRLEKDLKAGRDIGGGQPRGLQWERIIELIPKGGAIVAPMATTVGGAVLVVPSGATPSDAHLIPLPKLTYHLVDSWLRGAGDRRGWIEAYQRAARATQDLEVQEEWAELIASTLRSLWDELMGPIDAKLDSLGLTSSSPIVLTVPGSLSVLPLHAAWRETSEGLLPFCAKWAVSYAPSAGVLSAIDERDAARGEGADRFLGIANPEDNLAFAQLEVAAVARGWRNDSRVVLEGASATREAVLTAMSTSSYVHFACHGVFDWQSPSSSALLLANDERLTLSDVLGVADLSRARITVLSACETGIIDAELAPSEFVGLPNAFLEAGSSCVVGSLWAVDDASTAIMMKRFSQLHFGLGKSPADALQEASAWLRTGTAQELEIAEWWTEVYRASGNERARATAERFRQNPATQPFSRPRFWAPFFVAGRAS